MEEAIQSYLKSVKHLCPHVESDALNFLENGLTISTLAEKHLYIQANTIQNNVGFVFSRLLRSFYLPSFSSFFTNFLKDVTIKIMNVFIPYKWPTCSRLKWSVSLVYSKIIDHIILID